MSNTKKIHANDILELLVDEGFITKNEIANALGCSVATVKSRLQELRKDKHPIIHNNNGLKAVTRKMVDENPELGAVLDANVDWFLKSVTGLQRIMIAGKPMFPAMRRAVGKLGYSRTERHEITRSCAKVATLLFMMDSFEDDDEAEGQAA